MYMYLHKILHLYILYLLGLLLAFAYTEYEYIARFLFLYLTVDMYFWLVCLWVAFRKGTKLSSIRAYKTQANHMTRQSTMTRTPKCLLSTVIRVLIPSSSTSTCLHDDDSKKFWAPLTLTL